MEFNAISVGFAFMSESIQNLHNVLYNQIFKDFRKGGNLVFTPKSLEILVDGLIKAHNLYGNEKAKILLVCERVERNILDQRGVELELAKKGVFTIRANCKELICQLKSDEKDKKIFM